MTEYIKREDAIKWATDFIEGVEEEEDICIVDPGGWESVHDYCEEAINCMIPSADVVERDSAGYEWCEDCKEYDHERHCCPRWNSVIRDTMDEIRQNAEKNWEKVEVVRCKDCKHYNEYENGEKIIGEEEVHDGWCMRWSGIENVNRHDYCSYGERTKHD